jgi:hypothetical protein
MNAEWTIGKDVEGSGCDMISSAIPALSNGTEETLRNVSQVTQRPERDSNRHVSNERRNLTTTSN